MAQAALQPFRAALTPMCAFSTNFSPDPAEKLDTVRVFKVALPDGIKRFVLADDLFEEVVHHDLRFVADSFAVAIHMGKIHVAGQTTRVVGAATWVVGWATLVV